MKFPLLLTLIFLLFSSYLPAQEKAIADDRGKSISELGVVYKGMPKEYLENAGFTEYLLLSSREEGSKEWMTFSDWTTPQPGDTITFMIEDGKVRDWIREEKKKEKSGQEI